MENFLGLLKEKILLCDGAMGTMLQKQGLSSGECPEYWNLTNADKVISVHKEYVDAGAEIILTNTFGANRIKLKSFNLDPLIKEINTSAVKNAKIAANESVFIAGNLGPTGGMVEPLGELKELEVYDTYKEQVEYLAKEGVDLIIIETMIDLKEANLATKAARENSPLPVVSCMTFERGKNGIKTVMGVDIPAMVNELEDAGADVIGSNCGNGPDDMVWVIKEIKAKTRKFIIAEPNAGLPQLKNGKVIYDGTEELMASYVLPLIDAGANIIGGCCGTTPEHIKLMGEEIERRNKG